MRPNDRFVGIEVSRFAKSVNYSWTSCCMCYTIGVPCCKFSSYVIATMLLFVVFHRVTRDSPTFSSLLSALRIKEEPFSNVGSAHKL